MKCEHCGKNEATFYCRSNINGRVSEVHLCPECAEVLGYTQSIRRSFRPMSLFEDDFFARPFALLDDLMGSRMLTEFPAPVAEDEAAAEVKETPELVSQPEKESFRRQCKRNALENRLKFAIEQEDFESAIKYRDELKAMKDEKSAS